MSYDLYFRSRSSAAANPPDFAGWFRSREHYQVNEAHAVYFNRRTGVYFEFRYNEEFDEADGDSKGGGTKDAGTKSDKPLLPVAFNLNYIRPRVFALEAEPEVAAFVRHFDLTILDPQNDGMGEGEYATDGFLRGWTAGNEFACRAARIQLPDQPIPTLPARRIEQIWRWNYETARRREEIGSRLFVPTILVCQFEGRVQSAVAWARGIPILLPEVDLCLVSGKGSLFWHLVLRLFGRPLSGTVLLTRSELEPILANFKHVDGDLPACEVSFDQLPADLERLLATKQPPETMPTGIRFESVLEQELVDRLTPREPD
jgi:hypothetical protein